MVTTHFFRKLVFSARLFMKNTSRGHFVLVFKPAAHPGVSDSCVPGGSGRQFDVGRTTSFEEGADATFSAPMDHESSMR